MPPKDKDKARAAGVSASSFLELKAEVASRENEYTKRGSKSKDSGKKGRGTIWARTNKGIAARRERDIAAMAADRSTSESAKAALERKEEIYNKLKRGKTAGLSDAQIDALLVDFDARDDDSDGDSNTESESMRPTNEDDPLVEYEDEFGRMRTARRSEVPRNLRSPEEVEQEDPYLEFNPINHFPVYEPSADRVAAIQEAASEATNPLQTHYDASRENRAKGAAFYNFSTDEEQRQKEMEALKQAREETERARRDLDAVDIRPGEGEGLGGVDGDGSGGGEKAKKSRAMEKRRRDLEERQRLVEAKKRKLKGLPDVEENLEASSSTLQKPDEKVDPFATLEAQTRKSSTTEIVPSSSDTSKKSQINDKSKTNDDSANKWKAADNFLAKIELDLLFKKAQD